MSDTFTTDFSSSLSIVVGYKLNKHKLLRYIKKQIPFESDEFELFMHNNLNNFNINTLGENYTNDGVQFIYTEEKCVLGIEVFIIEKDSNGLEFDMLNNLSKYKEKIDKCLNEKFNRLISEDCKVHFLIYDI
jgi:succinylglutamate desuccinylase